MQNNSQNVNPAEALESARKTRDAIARGEDLVMDGEGTLRAKNDRNSLDKDNIATVRGGNKFAAQWYDTNREQFDFEVKEIKRRFPNAELSMLPDDRVYWTITFPGIVDLQGNRHSWTFMMIYDSDHPHNKGYGGSIKVYPVKPTLTDMETMASRAGRGSVPHLYVDEFGNKVICTAPSKQVANDPNRKVTAITVAAWTSSWATHFQQGLSDATVWNRFIQH